MTSVESNETVKINRQVKAHLDAADRELMVANTVKSSAELWAAARLAAVITLKKWGLPHASDVEIMESIKVVDDTEGAEGKIVRKYLVVRGFYHNAENDYMELDDFLFCRPGATEFVDQMQQLFDKAR